MGGKAVLLLEEKRKKKINLPEERQEALKASLYILKKQKRKQTFLLYRLPLRSLTLGCTLYTGHFLSLVFFLSAVRNGDSFCTPAVVSFWEGLRTLC